MSIKTMLACVAALAFAACATEGANPRPSAVLSRATQPQPLGPAPRLFSRPGGDTPAIEIYLPQPADSGAVLVAPGCAVAELQRLFDVPKLDRVEELSAPEQRELARLNERRTALDWSFPCAATKSLAVAPGGARFDGMLAKLPGAGADAAADGGGPEPGPDFVVAVPTQCKALFTHFRILETVREQRDAPPPALQPQLFLSCEGSNAVEEKTGFRAAFVVVGEEQLPMLELSRGDNKLYVRRIDRTVVRSSTVQTELIAKLSRGFQITGKVGLRFDEVPFSQVKIALDVCVDDCDGSPPSHLIPRDGRLLCPDSSIPTASGDCSPPPKPFVLRERFSTLGMRVHDLTLAGDVFATFAGCGDADGWLRPLRQPAVIPDTTDITTRIKTSYTRVTSEVITPCVRDTSCTVSVPDKAELSGTALLSEIKRSCSKQMAVVQLAASAQLTGTLALTPDALPAGVRTLRVVSDKPAAEISVGSRPCTGNACTPEPAFLVDGPITLELEGVRLVAVAPTSADGKLPTPRRPANRVAIEARNAAMVVLRRAEIGLAPAEGAPAPEQFMTGVRVTDAKLVAALSSIHAYATAVDATRASIALIGGSPTARSLVAVLESQSTLKDLVDPDGAPIGSQVTRFAALHMSGRGSKAFLGGVRVSGPIGLLYDASGAGNKDVELIDTELVWANNCADRLFGSQSRALHVSTTGELAFTRTDIAGFGGLLKCSVTNARAAGGCDRSGSALVFDATSTIERMRARDEAPFACQVCGTPVFGENCQL